MAYGKADWLEKVGRNRWRITVPQVYVVPGVGNITVPAGYECDLFTLVPNTDSPGMWRAAVLHDFLYEHAVVTRMYADALFMERMTDAAVSAYIDDMAERPDDVSGAQSRLREKLRTASIYYLGVSGLAGRAFIGVKRLYERLTGRERTGL